MADDCPRATTVAYAYEGVMLVGQGEDARPLSAQEIGVLGGG